MHKSAEEIEDLCNHASCGYRSLDKDGVIRKINDTELDWQGYTRDEVIGKMKLHDLLSPAGLLVFQENFPEFIKHGCAHNLEIELIRKDGTTLLGLVNATAIHDAGGNYLLSRSTIFGITARKRAEEALRPQSEITANAAEGIPVLRANAAGGV